MTIDFDEVREMVVINGKKFSIHFFDALIDPDESWLYRFRTIDNEIVIERVIQMCQETITSANRTH